MYRNTVFFKSGLLILLLAALCMNSAFAANGFALFSSDPAEGSEVEAGSVISYTLIMEETIEAEALQLMLQVRLGTGMELVDATKKEDSAVHFVPAETDEEKTRNVEIIPGNDGILFMADALYEGDTISFQGRVAAQDATVTASVALGTDTLALSHRLKPPPATPSAQTPTPALTAAPTLSPLLTAAPVSDTPRRILFAVLGTLLLAGASFAILRHPYMRKKKADEAAAVSSSNEAQ